ncbi:MAG: hypothetical protein KH828_12265 [Clostridiales bacterium]|nr:hypothetical protein [Clostridiales bacterium]
MKNFGMTSRERLLNTFYKKEVDRFAWSPLIDDYFIRSLPEQSIHMDILEAMRYIGNDIMERHVAGPEACYDCVEIRVEESRENKSYRTWYETPVGKIFEERKYSGETSFITRPLIESVEDMKIYEYVVQNMSFKENIAKFVERDRLIGDDGMATPSGMLTPIQQLLQHLAGVENTVFLMYDYEEEMNELLNAMHENNLKQYRILAEYPAKVVFAYEDTSSTVMSRDMFMKYSVPLINEYANLLHKSDKMFITHMCGCLNAFKHEIKDGLQDGIDSLCPPCTGDLYAWEARRVWGDNKVIIGGIDPPKLSRMNTKESAEEARMILEKMRGERGFILSTGDAVSYGTPIENLKAITKVVETFQ